MLSSQRADIRLGSSRRREKAENKTSAVGIAISVNGRMTMLIANVQAPRAGTPASLPIRSERTRSSIRRAQRPPAIRIANAHSLRNDDTEKFRVGCHPARHQSAL